MRLRRERKLRKLTGMGSAELLDVVRSGGNAHCSRVEAAKSMLSIGDRRGMDWMLKEFFLVEDKIALWKLALEIENCGDRCAVGPLVRALRDTNEYRRGAAARALGWLFGTPSRRRGRALAGVLADVSQPVAVRETAAESLAYVDYPAGVSALVAGSRDVSAWVRFWSVFALGGYLNSWHVREEAIAALEFALDDHTDPGGGYWPIALEALAQLGLSHVGGYAARLKAEIEFGVNANWVEYYGDKT